MPHKRIGETWRPSLRLRLLLAVLAAFVPLLLSAQPERGKPPEPDPVTSQDIPQKMPLEAAELGDTADDVASTISTIRSLISVRDELRADIQALNKQVMEAQSAAEKQGHLDQIEKLNKDLNATLANLQDVAAGANLANLRETAQSKFDFQQELFSLLEPAIKEMKDLTSHVRAKTEQRDKIAYYGDRVPVTEMAIANLERLLQETDDPLLQEALNGMLVSWQRQNSFLRTELQSAELQLSKLESAEETLAEASQGYLKSFFNNRGRYLGQALLVVLAIIALSRLVAWALQRLLPGYRQERRSFGIRVLDLSHRLITALLLIIGPMVVFYLAEDWLLFSVGILLLLGIGLGLRHAIPRYWQQVQLFLNVGAVREGERVYLHGLPWLVKQINLYTMLENPTAGLTQRLKIDDLVDMRSRPLHKAEPWFPCRMGDWVLLNDGVRGRVVGLSQEMVELVERGGAHRTYTTSSFLDADPLNLSVDFRIKEVIGYSYNLQRQLVSTIPDQLRAHIERRLTEEGYGDRLLNLRVEFNEANSSSLDLVVIADFKGELADLYNRLRRSLQRYCVEASSEHGWEIPFNQLTLHQAGT